MSIGNLLIAIALAWVALTVAFWLLVSRLPRCRMVELLAARLGYCWSPDGGAKIPDRLCFMQLFSRHSKWVVNNLMFDRSGDVVVEIFDCTSLGSPAVSAGVVAIEISGAGFEQLILRRETVGDKLRAAAGLDDIDFESHEFSEKFFVQCASRRFAYDVITARQMELLLPVDEVNIEMGESAAIFYLFGRPKVEKLEALHGLAREFLSNVPGHILSPSGDERAGPA